MTEGDRTANESSSRRTLLHALAVIPGLVALGCSNPTEERRGLGTASGALTALGMPEGWFSVKDYGAIGDGVADDHGAFVATIAAAGTGVVYVPPGIYRMSQDLVIESCTRVIGVGGSGTGDDAASVIASSRLLFDEGFGLKFESASTSASGGSAAGSIWRDLEVRQANPGTGIGDGITIRVRVTLDWVTVRDFGGNGIVSPLGAADEGTRYELNHCHVFNCRDGFRLLTGNTTIVGGSAFNCRGYGLFIANVFGCAVFGLKLRGCPSGLQATGPVGSEDGQGQHVLTGCSVPGGNGPIRLGRAALWIGGPDSAGFTVDSTGLRIRSAHESSPMQFINRGGTVRIESGMGVDATSQIAFQWAAPARVLDGAPEDPYEYRLFYDEDVKKWLCKHMGGGVIAYELTAANHADGGGKLNFPHGHFNGPGANSRFIGTARAAPSSPSDASTRPGGLWRQGDRIYNAAPSVGGTLEWVCIEDGVPGTWVAIPVPAPPPPSPPPPGA